MVDKKVFIKGMEMLSIVYPKFELNDLRMEVFYKVLAEYDNDSYKYAINAVLKENTFAPTPADISRKIEGLKPSENDEARDFESRIFSVSTDTLINYYKRIGNATAVKVLENNYKSLREANTGDIKVIKSQMREQYTSIEKMAKNKQIINDNNLAIGLNAVKNKILTGEK